MKARGQAGSSWVEGDKEKEMGDIYNIVDNRLVRIEVRTYVKP